MGSTALTASSGHEVPTHPATCQGAPSQPGRDLRRGWWTPSPRCQPHLDSPSPGSLSPQGRSPGLQGASGLLERVGSRGQPVPELFSACPPQIAMGLSRHVPQWRGRERVSGQVLLWGLQDTLGLWSVWFSLCRFEVSGASSLEERS